MSDLKQLQPMDRMLMRQPNVEQRSAESPTTVPAVQARSRRARLQRRGSTLPGGAQIVRTNGQPDQVVAAMTRLSNSIWGGSTPDWGTTRTAQEINDTLGRANFTSDLIQINHLEERGANMRWTGTVSLRIENPALVDSGEGGFTAGGGGSTSHAHTTTETHSSETGASAEGSAGGHEGAPGGSASGSQKETDTRTETSTTTGTASATTSAESRDRLQRYQANIVANISLRFEPIVDWYNPFSWGMGLGSAISPGTGSTTAAAGTVVYQVSGGFAGAPQ